MNKTPVRANAEGVYEVSPRLAHWIDGRGMGGSLWRRYRWIRKVYGTRAGGRVSRGLALRVALHHWLENPPRKPPSENELMFRRAAKHDKLIREGLKEIHDRLAAIENKEA